MIMVKQLSATEPPTRNVFYFFLFGTLLLLPPAVVTWQTPTLVQFGWLFAAGFLGVVGQEWLARAYDAASHDVLQRIEKQLAAQALAAPAMREAS